MAKAINNLQAQPTDRINTHRASKIYGRSVRTMRLMFSNREFKTAKLVGSGHGQWEVSRQEVIALKHFGKLTDL